MSKPPQPESSGESFKVQNAQTTIFLGHATFSPVYFAFPSVSVMSPAQRNFFHALSSSSRMSLCAFSTDSRYTGNEESTDFVRQTRPA